MGRSRACAPSRRPTLERGASGRGIASAIPPCALVCAECRARTPAARRRQPGCNRRGGCRRRRSLQRAPPLPPVRGPAASPARRAAGSRSARRWGGRRQWRRASCHSPAWPRPKPEVTQPGSRRGARSRLRTMTGPGPSGSLDDAGSLDGPRQSCGRIREVPAPWRAPPCHGEDCAIKAWDQTSRRAPTGTRR